MEQPQRLHRSSRITPIPNPPHDTYDPERRRPETGPEDGRRTTGEEEESRCWPAEAGGGGGTAPCGRTQRRICQIRQPAAGCLSCRHRSHAAAQTLPDPYFEYLCTTNHTPSQKGRRECVEGARSATGAASAGCPPAITVSKSRVSKTMITSNLHTSLVSTSCHRSGHDLVRAPRCNSWIEAGKRQNRVTI